MGDEYEYDEELDEEFTHPSRRFRKGDLIVLALDTAYNFVGVMANTLAIARNLAGMHQNYRVDQDNFRRQAALDIETITGEQDG